MAGYDKNVHADIVNILTAAWTTVVGDNRLTSAQIFTSMSLQQGNYENLQKNGTIPSNGPFAIIVPGNLEDAPDTPVHWFAGRINVTVSLATIVSDPLFQVVPGNLADGIVLAQKMGNLIEYIRQQFMLHHGNFKCYNAMPAWSLSESFLSNHSFYALMDGKYAGHLMSDIMVAKLYDPSNPGGYVAP